MSSAALTSAGGTTLPMNRAVRVLLVGRHFWPHGSIDSAGYLVDLASGLNRRGLQVQVCTPRFAASWPEKFWFREIPVHRPASAPRSDWSMGRYTRHLTSWLRQQAAAFDVVFVDAIREESVAAIEAVKSSGAACVLRYGGWGNQSDARFWKLSRTANRAATFGRMADAVVAKSASCSRTLIAERFSPERIVRIQPGFAARSTRSVESRSAARRTLAAVNSDLRTESDTPVAICNAPMTSRGGIVDLVKATRHLIAQFPNLRIWFIGDGPHRDWIYDQLRGDGARASIAMPGSFNNSDDLYAAADFYIQTDDSGLDHFLTTAVSAELPIVAVDSESVRTVLMSHNFHYNNIGQSSVGRPGDWVRWIDQPTPRNYVAAVSCLLGNLQLHRSMAVYLRRHCLRVAPQTGCIDQYAEMFERLVAKKSGTRVVTPTEAIR